MKFKEIFNKIFKRKNREIISGKIVNIEEQNNKEKINENSFENYKDYEEIITTIGQLREGDLVKGTDGNWYPINLLPIHTPDRMFEIKFENGKVKCSQDHLWTFFSKDGYSYTESTLHIFESKVYDYNFGHPGGPKILDIKEIKPEFSRCIEVANHDHLFEILTDEYNPIFTNNCQQRFVCGRVGSVASMMALGSTQATLIDGNHRGAGIVSANGSVDMIQYYYADHSWLKHWYECRGLDEKGHDPNAPKEKEIEDLEILEGEEELEITRDVLNIDFADIHKEVDRTQSQKFEEV